ncbi:acyl carrier protein [Segniliparus rugosus]|uniref:Carrier domain-containing protein n=1 Tax=Segniliparus rugosus (strain ATCC BAA-974 / DSM 45345 / CCUG 50838 / CIP 108380 / JCM 13579 / CDC 945) TaxID=679197 RepID=E5XNQ4_SEGRC|nr:acyl carrier protein [Segniliparus rugosus]EFV14044.1 hypothetical protein HMPREF9336_01125 [Segniliparus rugosus ATCC BAA-974]
MEDRIRSILKAHGRLSVDPETVPAEADLYSLGLSSHGSVNVMLAIEEEFSIAFPDEFLKKSTFASISAMARTVRALQDML